MINVDIISGFLGAGKTTLISKLLKEVFAGEKVVLIENEFGEIGVDGGFLKDAGIEIREINAGCICCSLVGDFEAALQKVVDTYQPERILIEPSGVGKLSDIMNAVKTIEGVEIHTACVVVDAKKCKVYSRNFKEFFNDQIAAASCVILSKTQFCDDAKLEETTSIVKEINPKARVITTNWDELTGKEIFSAIEGSFKLMEEDVCPVCGHHHDHDHHHDEECCCGHDHDHEHHHDEECCCGHDHDHEHHHDEECCCGHDHDHEHHHDEECCCDHDHEHHHDEECCCGHDHDHEHHHDHHHHHHHADEVFTAIGIETIKKFSKDELETILSQLDENILRAKGIVANKEGGWLFFDYVPGDIDIRTGSAAYTGLITVIGSKVEENTVKTLFGVK